ncbi:UDP-glucose dehydrogenase family protein [Litorihabitans aurantiacus]|uniref:UDP-glucose 6-dehydrogenase n=1 Tax=Litorihabitans aurantiacus TaxID=1930061 RepID=A0AA37ULT1_9MICO|nr:UDP-glucose/GDP-mannose dehydrogenase family protein [Litorihabitans aurantiacus]GMA30379.1 UDP-glucose 6-dehydrogenase [Litorihabitans aurantiacus]
MNLSVIGCGYLGAVHASCMADLGHTVVGVDVDAAKVARLNAGDPPFHEPGLGEVLQRALASGRLRFTTDMAEVAGAEVHFIGVGTPQQLGTYAADLTYVDAAVDALVPHLTDGPNGPAVIAGKSTVPVGTAARLAETIGDAGVLVWNPEFLREGFAVQDTVAPDRLVYGLPPEPERAARAQEALDGVYVSILERGTPRLTADWASAELVKVAANSFLATKISFINAMAEMCEATGADVSFLAEAIGHDDRIGKKFLKAGVGFGGGCLPKDIRAFMARAGELGAEQSLTFLREIDSINLRRRQHVVNLTVHALEGRVPGKPVAVLGAAFKPHSDDIRDSPALDVASRLSGLGAKVRITDPAAGPVLRQVRPDLDVRDSAGDAIDGAHAVLLLTEWPEFVSLDPVELGERVAQRTIIDGRNVLDSAAWRAAGWTYVGLGRP